MAPRFFLWKGKQIFMSSSLKLNVQCVSSKLNVELKLWWKRMVLWYELSIRPWQNCCRKNRISLWGWAVAFSDREWLSCNTQYWVVFVIWRKKKSKIRSILKHVFFIQIHLIKTFKDHNAFFFAYYARRFGPPYLKKYLPIILAEIWATTRCPSFLHRCWTTSPPGPELKPYRLGEHLLDIIRRRPKHTNQNLNQSTTYSTDGTAALFASGKSFFASWKKKKPEQLTEALVFILRNKRFSFVGFCCGFCLCALEPVDAQFYRKSCHLDTWTEVR